MQLASLLHQYQTELKAKYAARLLPGQHRAMAAILRCRTPAAGQIRLQCSECAGSYSQPLSCGHRSCPQCLNHQASVWLDRQRAKLLPLEYFMVTFSVPRELRPLAWRHQRLMYKCLFDVASSTLKDFGLNPKHRSICDPIRCRYRHERGAAHAQAAPGLSPTSARHRARRGARSGTPAMEKNQGLAVQ